MKRYILLLLCVVNIGILRPNLYEEIAQENLKALVESEIAKDSQENVLGELINDDKAFCEVVQDVFESQKNPGKTDKRQFAFTLLTEYEEAQKLCVYETLDKQTWQDLEILCGPRSNPSYYLASRLDRTSTEVGKIAFYRKIIQPTDDVEALKNQQSITKELVANEKLFNVLDSQLKSIEEPENVFMSFWDDSIFHGILSHRLVKVPLRKKVSLLQKLHTVLNKSELMINLKYMKSMVEYAGGFVFTTMGIASIPLIIGSHLIGHTEYEKKFKKWNKGFNLSRLSYFTLAGIMYIIMKKALEKVLRSERHASQLSGAFATPSGIAKAVYSLWYEIDDFKCDIVIDRIMQAKISYLATYINSIKRMIAVAQKNKVLASHIPAIQNFEKTWRALQRKNDNVKQLFKLLQANTFKGDPSFFSNKGKILLAYHLMHDVKNLIVELSLIAGELDAQMSIARLYKEFAQKRVAFCFPTYANHDTPAICAQDFWNPMVDSDCVVANSLSLGAQYNVPQNVIITGPNAGGKSTIMKGLLISVILGQSLGIAPARALTFTPFNKIMSYLNITDDIAAGNSHFKAGVLRARDLVKTVKGLGKNKFALTAVDEVFNGTTPKEGQAAAYSMIKYLGSERNNICLTATHFPRVPELAKETGLFKNYKVSVGEDENNKIVYPFKLEPGISNQIVTFKILEEEGFGDAFLAQARKELQRSS